MKSNAYFYALIAVFFWSTVATAFKLALRNINYIQMLFYSSLFSSLVLFILLLVQKKSSLLRRTDRQQWQKSALQGLLNPFCYYLILFKAYSILPAQQAQPLNFTWPIMLVIFSMLFLKEKIQLRNFIGILISFCGVVVIATEGELLGLRMNHPWGVLLATGSSLFWATYWLLNIQDTVDVVFRMFLNFIFGTLYISILALAIGCPLLVPGRSLMLCLYIGIFEMGFTFVVWSKALQISKSALVSHLVYLSPFISLLFIHFVLHEEILAASIWGLILIIAGILLGQKRK
ncbi:DMT family transporter [candidate division CSSED10-310 bacterium]|uniref:DMT family transporter n=1 Tax=candidate division CSSED10-310 bacterium TaxID=2855610 RepID=A0ABV6YZV2_UNCC1